MSPPSDGLEPDEMIVLDQYRKLRVKKHGDLDISVKDGKLVKLWTVDKTDLSALINTLVFPARTPSRIA